MILNPVELKKIALLGHIVLINDRFECVLDSIRIIEGCYLTGILVSRTDKKEAFDCPVNFPVILTNIGIGDEKHIEMKRNGISQQVLATFQRDGIFFKSGEKLIESVPHIKDIELDGEYRVLVNLNTLLDDVELSVFIKDEQLIVEASHEEEPLVIIDIDDSEAESGLTVLPSNLTNKLSVQLKTCRVDIELGLDNIHIEVMEVLEHETNIIDSVKSHHQKLLKTA